MTTSPKLWKSPTQVNTTDNGYEGDSRIAGLQDGGYVVIWRSGAAIFGQRYDSAGNKVGGEAELCPSVDGWNVDPAVTVLADGNIAVAFTFFDLNAPNDPDIHVRIFDPALKLIRTDIIDTSNTKQTDNPSITALADGGYVVSYTAAGIITRTGDPADTDIVARIVSPTGVVGAQFDIDTQNDNQDRSQVATLSNGNFVVVYEDEYLGSQKDIDIRYGIFTPTGAPVGLTGLYVPGANGNYQELYPDVVALRGGGFVVVWSDPDDYGHIQAAILSNTGTLVRDNINLNSPSIEEEANVVALADGGFLVSWRDFDASSSVSVCWAQRFDADGDKIGAQLTVKDEIGAQAPEAALLSDGHIAFALGDFSTGDTDVATAIYSVDTPNDFNADGMSDILWQKNDGTPAVWLMNGLSPISFQSTLNPGAAWHVVDAGDFNGDDHADVLLQNDDGTPMVLLSGSLFAATLPNPGPAWHAIDTGDFNGDGRADILWQNTDGTPAVWLMDGGSPISGVILPNPSPAWHAIGTGDFNGDNRADLLWQADDGTPSIWLMDGLTPIASGVLPNPSPAWHVMDTGDFNGDGRADILWQHDNGTPAVWLMDGL